MQCAAASSVLLDTRVEVVIAAVKHLLPLASDRCCSAALALGSCRCNRRHRSGCTCCRHICSSLFGHASRHFAGARARWCIAIEWLERASGRTAYPSRLSALRQLAAPRLLTRWRWRPWLAPAPFAAPRFLGCGLQRVAAGAMPASAAACAVMILACSCSSSASHSLRATAADCLR